MLRRIMRELEPLSFDRAVRDAAREIERRKLSGESLDDALPDYLLDPEALHWLRELKPKDPLAAPLEQWLLRLLEEVALGSRRRELGRSLGRDLHGISEPEQAQLPLAEMFRLALARPRERAAYLRGFFASSAQLAELVRRLWEERLQFAEAQRTSLDSFEVASPALLPAAREFLASSKGAFETLEAHDPSSLLGVLLAESAQEGWPARLTQRSTLDLLGDATWIHGLRVRAFRVPSARGASSFALGLAQAGRAIVDAANAQRSPFALAHDVFDVRRDRFAALLALIPLSPAFGTKRLGLGASRAREQGRALAGAAIADARVSAFRVLLRELLLAGQRRLSADLPELSHAALGFELPPSVAGVFVRVRPRDSQRFGGRLLAAAQFQALVQSHDEDWFRNPRAIAELRAGLSEPMPDLPTEAELSTGAAAFLALTQSLL